MIRSLALFGAPAAVMTLSACGGMAGESYGLEPGVATYDALRAASEACQSRGGALSPHKGAEGRNMTDYECVIGKAR